MAGFLSGLGADVTSLLNNPAVQTLLPTVAGAAGAALTSPRGTGGRGQLGRALLGASEGYMSARDTQEIGLRTQYLQAQVNALNQATKDRATWQKTWQGLLQKIPEGPDKIEFATLASSSDPSDWAKAAKVYGSAVYRPASEKMITSHSTLTADDLKGYTTDEVHKLGLKISEAGITPDWEKGDKYTDETGHMWLVMQNKKDGSIKRIPLNTIDPKWKQAQTLLQPKKENLEARTKLLNQLGITPQVVEKMQADADKEAEEFMKNRGLVARFMTLSGLNDPAQIKAAKKREFFEKKMEAARTLGRAVGAPGSGGLEEGETVEAPD